MKLLRLLGPALTLALLFAGCATNSELTDKEKEQIEKQQQREAQKQAREQQKMMGGNQRSQGGMMPRGSR